MDFPSDIKNFFQGKFEYDRKKLTLVYDEKTFPKCSNKTEEIGRLRVKKFIVHCDGKGKVVFDEVQSFDEKINKCKKLLDKGIISPEDFEDIKNSILRKIK